MGIGEFLSPTTVLAQWWDRLTSPLGMIFLAGAVIWIWLRVTGKISGIGLKGRNNEKNRPPDYIIK